MNEPQLKCALLSSFTLDQLPNRVDAYTVDRGVKAEWYIAPFNQYPQQILDRDSALYAFQPSIVFVAIAAEDLYPSANASPQPRDAGEAARQQAVADFRSLIARLAESLPRAAILINNFYIDSHESQPLLSMKASDRRATLVHALNGVLLRMGQECDNVFPLDVATWLALGKAAPQDPRFYYLAKIRLGREALDLLARLYARAVLAHAGRRQKCIVLDLDNTLWGGIVGEDGLENLSLSDDGPGRAFADFQRILLDLNRTGILLAICSKNDHDVAMAAVREHPHMILQADHFAAIRINWDSKAANLRSIADELNIGLDSLIFLDDSAHEREHVRLSLPSVIVPDLPTDPSEYPSYAASLPFVDTLVVTDEDAARSRLYAHERERRHLYDASASLDQFLHSLQIRVAIEPVTALNIGRCAQLTQRTNQFNLTTRRYTAETLADLLQQHDWHGYAVTCVDRIGDSGIVGFGLARQDGATAIIDTFLLSCRVLGRGIEAAFVAAFAARLEAMGCSQVIAEFLPTGKNTVAQDFLPTCGFVKTAERWTCDTKSLSAITPAWITIAEPLLKKGR